MVARLYYLIVIAVAFALMSVAPAFAGSSYQNRIEKYVRSNPSKVKVVKSSLAQAGWDTKTASGRRLIEQAVRVAAGESGMQPTNDRNASCSGLFQIYRGKSYGRWSAADIKNPRVMRKYTVSTFKSVRVRAKDGTYSIKRVKVVYYAPKVGQYKIFNPVFNAMVARKMHTKRGWQPWTVARKLGYR